MTSGSFIIPIVSLNVLNLEGDLKAMLENHLKSGDFFNGAIHPNAKFEIKKVSPYTGKIGR
ncbi:YceI family protein [Mucilaginibacter phyllosphaerae]